MLYWMFSLSDCVYVCVSVCVVCVSVCPVCMTTCGEVWWSVTVCLCDSVWGGTPAWYTHVSKCLYVETYGMYMHTCMHLIERRQAIECACSESRVVGEMELENRMHVCSKRETPISSYLPWSRLWTRQIEYLRTPFLPKAWSCQVPLWTPESFSFPKPKQGVPEIGPP